MQKTTETDYFLDGVKDTPHLVAVSTGDHEWDMSHNLSNDEAVQLIDYLMANFEIVLEPNISAN